MGFLGDIRKKARDWDKTLDSRLTHAEKMAEDTRELVAEYNIEARKRAKDLTELTSDTMNDIDQYGDDLAKRLLDVKFSKDISDIMLSKPKAVLIFMILISGLIAGLGTVPMFENISGDLDIYLPAGHDATIVIGKINEVDGWSTDIVMLYVETDNVGYENRGFGHDITDIAILNEMSAIEGQLNFNPNDLGDKDGITYVLSVSSIIKELNTTARQVNEALEDELGVSAQRDIPGEYSIPQNQDDIDRLYEYIPEEIRKMLITDTNDDGIMDTASIIIGIEPQDQAALMTHIQGIIDANAFKTTVVTTGPVAMTVTLTERTFEEFMRVIPLALIGIFIALLYFHRTWKIVIVAGMPIIASLGMLFGIIGLLGIVVSPQIILVAPILLALGVAYSLYIANRYSNDREEIPDNEERIRNAISTTGRAIFLSAVTTAIGFGSLMTVNMIPMQVLGFALTLGILICWGMTMLMVPALVLLLDYQKKPVITNTEKIGLFPLKNRKKIVVAIIIITMISLALIPSIGSNLNLTEMSPQDEPAITYMDKYSEEFGGGQMGMAIINEFPQIDSMRNYDVLLAIDIVEGQMRQTVPDLNSPISVVDLMKMIQVPADLINETNMHDPLKEWLNDKVGGVSFWDAIQRVPDDENSAFQVAFGKTARQAMINIFYRSISDEFKGMVVNLQGYSQGLIYIDIPAQSAEKTKVSVEQVNEVTDQSVGVDISHLTGFAAVVVAVNELILFNSYVSLITALIMVFIVLIMIFRSLKYATMTMVPVLLVVLWQPLTYAIAGIEVNLLTAMLGSIIVGIGIDYGIHMTERVRAEGETLMGIKRAVETTGLSFTEATITIIAGISSIFVINIIAIQEFALMTILMLTFSVIGAVLVLPALYALIISEEENE